MTRDEYVTVIASIRIPKSCIFIKEYTKIVVVIGDHVYVFTTSANNPVKNEDLPIIAQLDRNVLARHHIQLLDTNTSCVSEIPGLQDMHMDLLLSELNWTLQSRCSQNIKI